MIFPQTIRDWLVINIKHLLGKSFFHRLKLSNSVSRYTIRSLIISVIELSCLIIHCDVRVGFTFAMISRSAMTNKCAKRRKSYLNNLDVSKEDLFNGLE